MWNHSLLLLSSPQVKNWWREFRRDRLTKCVSTNPFGSCSRDFCLVLCLMLLDHMFLLVIAHDLSLSQHMKGRHERAY